MENNSNKHRQKFRKRNSNTKLITKEYAIINKEGEVQATNNRELAEECAKQGLQVYIITTYQLTIKQPLK